MTTYLLVAFGCFALGVLCRRIYDPTETQKVYDESSRLLKENDELKKRLAKPA